MFARKLFSKRIEEKNTFVVFNGLSFVNRDTNYSCPLKRTLLTYASVRKKRRDRYRILSPERINFDKRRAHPGGHWNGEIWRSV